MREIRRSGSATVQIWFDSPDPRLEEGGFTFPPSLGVGSEDQKAPVQVRYNPYVYEVKTDSGDDPERRLSKGFSVEITVDLKPNPGYAAFGSFATTFQKEEEVGGATIIPSVGKEYPVGAIALFPIPVEVDNPNWLRGVVLLTNCNVLLETPRFDFGVDTQRTLNLICKSTSKSEFILGIPGPIDPKVPNFRGLNFSILNAPPDTQFYFVIDTTSIESGDVATISDSVENLKPLLVQEVFEGDETKADTNVSVIESNVSGPLTSGAEDWMNWFNTLYSENAVYFFWMDESESNYHGETPSDPTSPTATWDNHFTAFKDQFDQRGFFFAKVYHTLSSGSTRNDAFRKHLQEAITGSNGYESVGAFGVQGVLDLDPNGVTAEDYLNDFLGETTIGTPI